MSPAQGEEGSFKVTDRRRRSDEPAPPPAGSAAEMAPPSARPPGERSLVALFMMLGTSALVALGEDADPATPPQRDLPAAAEFIDVLLLLRDKTEGRRSEQETRVLEDLLYDLQLRYVTATKRPG
ncbi:MAG TPA: DUF1844 domain-containing protein [Methylomirabilota bacterium]|nr:DUF1844 domain-containing protein [Methylomirabilota bacterium]